MRIPKFLKQRSPKVVRPHSEQLVEAADLLISSEHVDLGEQVTAVVPLSRGEIPDSLYNVIENLLIVLDWSEHDPDEDETREIRAYLALVRQAAAQ